MKLAKKMLACLMALALVCCFAAVAFAAEDDTTAADTTVADTTVADTTAADTTVADTTAADTTVADTTAADTTAADTTAAPATTSPYKDAGVKIVISKDKKAVVGEKITLTFALEKAKGIGAANFFMTYDKSVLEFDSSADIAAGKAGMVVAEKVEDGKVTVSIAATTAIAVDDISLATFTFKVLKEGDPKLDVTVKALSDGNNADMDYVKPVITDIWDTAAESTTAGTTAAGTTGTTSEIPKTGDTASLAVAAGLVVLAGAAFVVSKKRK